MKQATGKVEPLKWTWEALLPFLLQNYLDHPENRSATEATFRWMAEMADNWKELRDDQS